MFFGKRPFFLLSLFFFLFSTALGAKTHAFAKGRDSLCEEKCVSSYSSELSLDSHLSGLSFLLGFEMKSPCPCCQPACSQASGVSVLAVSNAANSPVLPRGRNHRKRSPVLCCVNSKSKSDLLNGSKSFEMPVSHPGAWKCAAHLYV